MVFFTDVYVFQLSITGLFATKWSFLYLENYDLQ
jgi:hypothetical protein